MINKKNKSIRFNIKKVLNNIKITLTNYYGNKLKAIILYGSFARDEANSDSDLDIAIVFKGNIDKIAELERIHNLIYDIGCNSGELISVYPITEKELEDLEWPLNYNISLQGITI
ncbi:MAG: nucleotidyltransferase domain-containing protein [Candidatus Cloacimonadota bacterium]|nr:nucleotidyltransferase domain-containing protein [Candidatus Cloacimonadota bacterium]